MSLRVLHVIPSLSLARGGTTTSVLQMTQGLEAQGVSCDFATSDDDGPDCRLAADAPERAIRNRVYFPRRLTFYTYTPAMKRWLETHLQDYDLAHIHGLFSHVNGVAARCCRRLRVPYIVSPHGMANRYGMSHKRLFKQASMAAVEGSMLRGATFIHVASRDEERDLDDLRIQSSIVQIPHAVPLVSTGDARAFRSRFPEIGANKIAIFIGRIDPIKNIESAIDALSLPSGRQFHLFVGGSGPEAYVFNLKARAEARGVSDRVTWLGFVSGELKANALAAGDIFLQPSVSESFGLAAVEAVSAGLPCVLGENVGVADDLADAGFAVRVSSTGRSVAEGMSQALEMCILDRNFRSRARSFVAANYSLRRASLAMKEIYLQAHRTK